MEKPPRRSKQPLLRGNKPSESPKHVTALVVLLGKAIKEARLARGLTQEDLAMLSNSAASTITKYEVGVRLPSPIAMMRIAKACQTVPSAIYSVWDTYQMPPLPDIDEKAIKPKTYRKWST